jgi:two-component system sensor histidine kinase CpxA
MRSIFAQILAWSLGTFALSLVAYWAIWQALDRRGPRDDDPFWRMSGLIESDAISAFEAGGPEKLAAHLRRLDESLGGEHLLLEADGRDLVTGADRSDLLHGSRLRGGGPPHLADGRAVLMRPGGGRGRYRFVTLARRWSGPPNILPYYGAVVLVIAGMGAILALSLAAPLRRMRAVVERFGAGDLAARSRSRRGDEIGELSCSFDEMADRIETLLGAERRLLQDVSHELRSPLARLGFALELARTAADREGALARARKEADRMAVLIGELLELTRAEGEPAEGEPEVVVLDDLLREIVRDAALEAEAHGCHLNYSAECLMIVPGRRELLRRAIENVVRNAIRHAPEGTAVDIDLARNGQMMSIVVRDRGPGVPDDRLEAIFRPFFRVDDDRSRAGGGVGLGLSIARRALSLHGGTISAHNAAPGLAVTLTLPGAGPFPS